MTETDLVISSRISALEFVLEVMLANQMASLPEEICAKFMADLISRPARLPPHSGPMDAEIFQELERRVTTDLENFAKKVGDREREIRAALTQDQ